MKYLSKQTRQVFTFENIIWLELFSYRSDVNISVCTMKYFKYGQRYINSGRVCKSVCKSGGSG